MNTAIIVAAGLSTRFAKSLKTKTPRSSDKLLATVGGFPLLYHTIQAFHEHPQINQIIIAANAGNKKAIAGIVKKYHFPKVVKIVLGAETRAKTMEKAFKSIKNPFPKDIVLIHNGANPLVTEKEITNCISACQKYGAAAVGGKITDTVKEIHKGHIIKTHNRKKLAGMQTPQGATHQLFKKALAKAAKELKPGAKNSFTDDASLIENLGLKVKLIPASAHNFKVTTAHDLERVRHLMGETPSDFLVGLGQDSHEFEESSATKPPAPLTLGGVEIKNQPKLKGESDGDVILHALYNAISQAIGGGSLGLFATRRCHVKGVTDSKKYLRPLLASLARKHYTLNNIGIQLECVRPKIDPLAPQIKKSLARITGLPSRRIGITATTGENLTSFGKGKGIQCFAIVSLRANQLKSK